MTPAALVLGFALASPFGPFATSRAPVTSEAARADTLLQGPNESLVSHVPWRAYRFTVGSFQGPRCPHVPSCSLYAAEAVRRHGLAGGGVVTVQRLLRGARSSALRALSRDRAGKYVDPLDEATFWLERRPR